MTTRLVWGSVSVLAVIVLLFTYYALVIFQSILESSSQIKGYRVTALSEEFGVVDNLSSLSNNSDKDKAVAKMTEAGFGWGRYEFTYSDNIDFAPYDAAQDRLDAGGIKVIGLLHFSGSQVPNLDNWKTFVNAVVSRYGSRIEAWEIMNEVDNHLSGQSYVPYLSASYDIIKGINSSAKVVSSGITSRPESTSFWDGIATGGGWGKFDVLGLHIYHSGYPEKVNFGGGDLVTEFDRVVANIKKNGGGKKIWVTETGYKFSEGEQNQADWITRTLLMAKTVSDIEKVLLFRLWDNGDGYGLLTSTFTERPVFGAVKAAVSQISGRNIGSKLQPQDTKTIEKFDLLEGWNTKATFEGTTTLSTVTGYTGNGMKIDYSFNAGNAYAIAEKEITIDGTPTALAIRINGDNTKNVWKLRFKDNNGETFQMDLGSISSGWAYKQFIIEQDSAITSWGGDGKINYPIKFNSVVIDRQGSTDTKASGIVDDLLAIYGSADLSAYQYSSIVAYWKSSGSDSAYLCGANRTFKTTPQYLTGIGECSLTPPTTTTAPSTTTSTPSTTTSTPTTTTTVPATTSTTTTTTKTTTTNVSIAKDQSVFRLDGENVVADGESSYQIVVILNDKDGKVIKDVKPETFLEGDESIAQTTTIGDPALIGDEWIIKVSATTTGERGVQIKAQGNYLTTLYPKFIEAHTQAEPEITTQITAQVEPVEETAEKTKLDLLVLGQMSTAVGALAIIIGLLIWWYKKYYRPRT